MRRRWGSTLTVEAEIDLGDVLSEMSNKELRDELASRKLSAAVDLEVLQAAYDALLRADVEHAKFLLQRALYPKWATEDDSAKAFKIATGVAA